MAHERARARRLEAQLREGRKVVGLKGWPEGKGISLRRPIGATFSASNPMAFSPKGLVVRLFLD
jgi:hypothetical protein